MGVASGLEMHRRQLCPGKTEPHGSSFCQSKLLTKSSPWRDTQEEYHLQKKHFPVLLKRQFLFLKTGHSQAYFFNKMGICEAHTFLNQELLQYSIPNEEHWGKMLGCSGLPTEP